MKKYTKLCLATLCFISSVSAFADGYKGEAPPLVPVSIPSFAGGFEFTLGAIYMTPDSSNLDYLGINRGQTVPLTTVNDRVDYGVNPSYDWGFLLGVGYVFPGTSNDVKLDWMYYHNDFKSTEYLVGVGQTMVFIPGGPPAAVDSLDGNEVLRATGKVDYRFDAVDLTFGQYLNFGSRLQTRLFAGLRYMRLDDDLSTGYAVLADRGTITGPINNTYVNGTVNSSFNGLGPLVGIKADYYLGAGWSLSGGIDGALLVGNLGLNASSHTAIFTNTIFTEPFELSSATDANYAFDNQNVIAPGFDAKFGLDYKYQFNNGTLLGFELGYQVTKYIDVVAQVDRNDGGIPFERLDVDVTNFRLAGPYLTMNVKI